MSTRTIRAVCADAHRVFMLGVRAALAAHPEIEVVGEADNGREALALVAQLKPDVLMLDTALPGASAFDVLDSLAARGAATRTIVIAENPEAVDLRAAILRGAHGLLSKHVAPPLLAKCILRVAAGEFWIGRAGVAHLVEALRRSRPSESTSSPLTGREREIVDAVIKGASNRDIGRSLGLGEQTVKNHLRRAFAKLGVTSRVGLALKMADGRRVP